MDISFIYGVLVSIGIGALIGLEREYRHEGTISWWASVPSPWSP